MSSAAAKANEGKVAKRVYNQQEKKKQDILNISHYGKDEERVRRMKANQPKSVTTKRNSSTKRVKHTHPLHKRQQ